jgi:hypothetical protein
MSIIKRIKVLPQALNERGGLIEADTTNNYQWVVLSSGGPMVLMSYLVDNVGGESAEITILRSKIPLDPDAANIDPDDDQWVVLIDEDTLTSTNALETVIDDQHDCVLAIGFKSNVAETHTQLNISLGASQ